MNKNLTLADDACETIRNVCIISSARNGIYLFVYFWLDCVALGVDRFICEFAGGSYNKFGALFLSDELGMLS